MAFHNAITPSAAYRFVYCCCIRFHTGRNTLKVNEPTLTDVREPLI
ncbi:hypothetical protein [Klebsiella pneumoniae IS33]|nr:hypothetical protein [Klebsiella pneumoniae IS33]CDL56382.1 hypothetical protein [Klebsiella pneumoniae]